MQVLPPKWEEENCTGMHLKGSKNQNEKYLVDLYESNNLETQVISPMCSELARTLIHFESTNNTKITVTRHTVIGYRCIWEGISLMNACGTVS